MRSFESDRLHRSDATRLAQAARIERNFDLHLRGASPALAHALSAAGESPVAILLAAILALADGTADPAAVAAFDRLRERGRATPRHDAVLGHALMAALKDGLETEFDEASREAWANGYIRLVEAVMARRRNRIDLVA